MPPIPLDVEARNRNRKWPFPDRQALPPRYSPVAGDHVDPEGVVPLGGFLWRIR